MTDLFSQSRLSKEEIYPDLFVLANFVNTKPLLEEVQKITQVSPFRKMMTPNGHETGVACTNCGDYGWTSDRQGYQYSKKDPLCESPWLSMPSAFSKLATDAALTAGFADFYADACLINQYLIGTKLGAHQDKNEKDFSQPIVSVSIGLPAVFQIFGNQRSKKILDYELQDGDVMVWGRSARMVYHGVKSLNANRLDPKASQRINLTFRKSH
ncbi:MAG: alkylated DNA repair protein (DNA oxidative demethylase) [Polaribacter sp.]